MRVEEFLERMVAFLLIRLCIGNYYAFEKDKIKTVKTKILNTSDWLNTTYFYDVCGRVERTESNHHLNLNNDAWKAAG